MATISKNNKHTKLSERIEIESGLNSGLSFKTICKDINKIISTIFHKDIVQITIKLKLLDIKTANAIL